VAPRPGAAKARGLPEELPEYPLQQGSSLNAAGINYHSLKAM
jgi:hypothetical protein